MKSDSVQSFSEKLAQRQQSAQEAEQIRTNELLKQHEKYLAELSQVALDTTRSVTKDQLELLAEALRNERILLTEHAGQMSAKLLSINLELDILGKSASRRLGWWLMWPLLITVLTCSLLTLGAAAWSGWTIAGANEKSDKILSDQQILSQQLSREFCSSPASQKNCRPAGK